MRLFQPNYLMIRGRVYPPRDIDAALAVAERRGSSILMVEGDAVEVAEVELAMGLYRAEEERRECSPLWHTGIALALVAERVRESATRIVQLPRAAVRGIAARLAYLDRLPLRRLLSSSQRPAPDRGAEHPPHARPLGRTSRRVR